MDTMRIEEEAGTSNAPMKISNFPLISAHFRSPAARPPRPGESRLVLMYIAGIGIQCPRGQVDAVSCVYVQMFANQGLMIAGDCRVGKWRVNFKRPYPGFPIPDQIEGSNFAGITVGCLATC